MIKWLRKRMLRFYELVKNLCSKISTIQTEINRSSYDLILTPDGFSGLYTISLLVPKYYHPLKRRYRVSKVYQFQNQIPPDLILPNNYQNYHFDTLHELTEFKQSYFSMEVENPAPPQLNLIAETSVPKYSVNDIVYVLQIPTKRPDEYNPFVGTVFEIDCKITSAQSVPGYGPLYNLISGHGTKISNLKEKFLIRPSEKHLYDGKKYFTLQEDTELCPKGTVFLQKGDYIVNEMFGIYILKSRFFGELNSLFKS